MIPLKRFKILLKIELWFNYMENLEKGCVGWICFALENMVTKELLNDEVKFPSLSKWIKTLIEVKMIIVGIKKTSFGNVDFHHWMRSIVQLKQTSLGWRSMWRYKEICIERRGTWSYLEMTLNGKWVIRKFMQIKLLVLISNS